MVKLVNAKVVDEDGVKFIEADKDIWGIEINGKRRYLRKTLALKNGDHLFTSTFMDIAEADKIAKILNGLVDDKIAEVKRLRKRAFIKVEMTFEDGKYYA